MISHKHKFIYIHIPKCGGTSVELALLKNEGIEMKNYMKDDLNFLSEEQKQKFRIGYMHNGICTQHRKIDEYKSENQKKYFTFTFIRNPWERFLSEYFYISKALKLDNRLNEYNDFVKLFPTFKHFVCGNFEKYFFAGHQHLQIDFVLNANQGKLTNFVGRCEDMQYDFDYVCGKIGIPKIKLPYRNPTKHKHYTEYYDEETRQIVAEKYAKDIEYFGYEFGE
jgi:hypothetical protein